jgi:UDP-glucose 4-epimerase
MAEDMCPSPEDPYGIAKLAVEQDLRAAHEMFNLNYVVFRAHNVYGERQNIGDRYRNVIGIFMNQIMQGQELSIFGDGEQTRAFSYIGDIASIIACAPHEPRALNEIFNIGADVHYTIRELAETVCSVFDVAPRLRFLAARKEVKHAYCSHEKIRSIFGATVSTPLNVGLRNMADWGRKFGPKHSKKFREIEIVEKLPSIWVE